MLWKMSVPFGQMMGGCGMLEFPFTENMLWVGKTRRLTIWSRLDQAVGNEDWHDKFSHSCFQYLRLWESDYRPLQANNLVKPIKTKKKMKFNKWWLNSEEIRQVILYGWNSLDLPTDANIMEHILSWLRELSQRRRQNDIKS